MKMGTHFWTCLPLLLLVLFMGEQVDCRKIRVQPRLLQQQQEDVEADTIQYYAAAEPQEQTDNRQRVVLVSSDQYNGLYGQPTASSRSAQDNYIPRTAKAQQYVQRVKDTPKEPPVQTIRNYNKVNDDGSFTFGYEAADGSFKEETRGTDCVVRGKYGYIDPDGNKREFTYVSGNPCDPNAPKDEDDEASERDEAENERGSDNYPTRPIRPLVRPASTPAPKPVTLFQTQYEQSEDEQPEPEQLLRPTPTPIRSRPQYISRPQYVSEQPNIAYQQAQPVASSTPLYRPVTITPRPTVLQSVSPTTSTRTQLPATTFKPQLLQVSVTPRPSLLYTAKPLVSSTPATSKTLDFDAEFQRFQQENNLVSPSPSSNKAVSRPSQTVGQIYSSALLYDPATGQYRNQLYQHLPQTDAQIAFNQRIQPYVQQQQHQQQQQQQQQQQRPTYNFQPSALFRQQQINPQAVYQAQQSEAQFQNSAQLYAQQAKAREQLKAATTPVTPPVYYIQPSVGGASALGAGQIDAFLRGHNIQF